MESYLLLHLQTINHRGQLTQGLVCALVEFELRGDQVRKVSQGLGGIEDLFQQISHITQSHK